MLPTTLSAIHVQPSTLPTTLSAIYVQASNAAIDTSRRIYNSGLGTATTNLANAICGQNTGQHIYIEAGPQVEDVFMNEKLSFWDNWLT